MLHTFFIFFCLFLNLFRLATAIRDSNWFPAVPTPVISLYRQRFKKTTGFPLSSPRSSSSPDSDSKKQPPSRCPHPGLLPHPTAIQQITALSLSSPRTSPASDSDSTKKPPSRCPHLTVLRFIARG